MARATLVALSSMPTWFFSEKGFYFFVCKVFFLWLQKHMVTQTIAVKLFVYARESLCVEEERKLNVVGLFKILNKAS